MHPLGRSPWTTLTASQTNTLVDALNLPSVVGLERTLQYRTISTEFAVRAARLLVMNDLRGAIDAAEVSRVADAMGEATERANEQARVRLEAQRLRDLADPNGHLVSVPGKKKRVRVFPADVGPSERLPRLDSGPKPDRSAPR
jgi:hypothetical protein